MHCPNCGQQTEPGKFCTSCGAQLAQEETAAASDPTGNAKQADLSQMESSQDGASQTEQNPAMENLKKEASNFGNYFIRLLKGPDEGQKMTGNELISGIITMVIFSLLISLGGYLIANQMPFANISFLDGFIIPFLQFIILFAVLTALTFGGNKLAAQSLTFKDVVAKFGAYTVPFLVLAVIGALLGLIGLSFAGTIIILGLIGPILIVPTFIILEQPANGFDRIYVLLGIYIISIFISGFLIESMMGMFMGGIFDSMF
ncbi:hypothetical protein CIL05_05935 [Virgibacillus profundi]|uniref:Zinc ribbon domain-containing protein n=1 Tax=Virgibacillus profundi TaxID=2024555 RepID=A0A2A2IFU1_9BACI|nr:zinc ribbon domain-containing protein [Virgibacillus profundi]PAV30639.1 hypothetical protein CIL05_05935 [Virgibacillus profundi]PXY54811.1 zinc ribbon domain-containing protein [Virgibacillus profundi]